VPALTKSHIVENLFAKNIFTKGECAHVIETLFELMKQSLESGEPMQLDPRAVVTFKCLGVLREAINDGER